MMPLGDLFVKKNILGVDIGTVAIKVAQMTRNGDKFHLSNYGIAEFNEYLVRSNSVIQSSALKIDPQSSAEALLFLINKMNIKTKEVVASLPTFSAFTSILELPMMNSLETKEAISYQARSVVPLPIDEVTLDWMPIGQFEDEKGVSKQQIFLVSIPNEIIGLYQSLFKKAGLDLKMLEVEGMSIARALSSSKNGNLMAIDLGGLSTNLCVISNGSLKYATQTDFAGNSLTQSLVKGLGISVQRAEILKRQRGLSGMTGEYGLSTLMQPFLDVIIKEGKRVRDIFERKYGQKIEKVVVLGGGADLLGVEKYIREQLGIETIKANALEGISFSPLASPFVPWIGSRFSVAIGGALKAFK